MNEVLTIEPFRAETTIYFAPGNTRVGPAARAFQKYSRQVRSTCLAGARVIELRSDISGPFQKSDLSEYGLFWRVFVIWSS